MFNRMLCNTSIRSHPDKVGIPQFCIFTFDFYLNKTTYLKKQTQFYAFFGPKTPFCQNQSQLKPIQSQFKPNSNPILSKLRDISVLCGEKDTFLCKTNPNFLVSSPKTAIWRKNKPKTKPNKAKSKNSQNEHIPCIDRAL